MELLNIWSEHYEDEDVFVKLPYVCKGYQSLGTEDQHCVLHIILFSTLCNFLGFRNQTKKFYNSNHIQS